MTPEQLLDHADRGEPWPAGSGCADLPGAYRTALAVRSLRIARGEVPVGWKIGFTNRGIWERYAVFAPIWGTVWAGGLLAEGQAVPLAGLCEPRLEPEIVFGLRATPPAAPSLEALFDCVDWLAPGFEIVQSHRPGWRFTAPDTVADGGLHGRLLVGARQPVRAIAPTGAALDAHLAAARVDLLQDGRAIDSGHGAMVLDGPLHALLHFVRELQVCPGAPTLQAGDVVTTGTWTDAWPLAPGQRWEARFSGGLGGVALVTA